MIQRPWPKWWHWELELTDHVLERMADRGFNETDLRAMFEHASGWRRNPRYQGRFLIETRHNAQDWVISVEPDDQDCVLVVITAFQV